MIANIDVVTVYVRDQDKALVFYIAKLGLEWRADLQVGNGMRRVEVAAPGEKTRIVLAKDYGSEWGESRVGKFTGIVFASRDVQATYETLHARGVVFSEPPAKLDWGFQAQFRDQDDNSFLIVERLL
jgi:predicted enzyme related to lactoylglutathione lyase